MGSGSKKAPSYAEAAAISPAIEAAPSSDVLLADEVAQSLESIEAGAYGHDPEGYEKFRDDVLHAASLIEQAGDPAGPLFGSATEEELASLQAELASAARHHLDDHLAEDLQGIALAEGFHHPAVFTKAGDDSPLAAWLHPLYSQETKGEIQQAAPEAHSLLGELPPNCTWPQVWSPGYADPLGHVQFGGSSPRRECASEL